VGEDNEHSHSQEHSENSQQSYYSEHSGSGSQHSINYTTDEVETIDLLPDENDDSYSSNAFPEQGDEFSTDDEGAFLSDDNMSTDDDEAYTSDDQDPYQSADGNHADDQDEYPESGDESFYEEETYYSSAPTRGDSFMTAESQDENGFRRQMGNNRNSSFLTQQSAMTIGTLGTLSEEGTVDLEDDSESQAEEGSIYEEQTVYTSELPGLLGRPLYEQHAIVEEEEEEDTDVENKTVEYKIGMFERNKIEATSSFYSTNAGNNNTSRSGQAAVSDDEQHSDEDEDYDDFNVNPTKNNNSQSSILNVFRTLSAVKEGSRECSEEFGEDDKDDKSIDESTIFGAQLGSDDGDGANGNSGPLPSRLMDSYDMERGFSSKRSLGDPLTAKEERARRKPRRGRGPRRGRRPAKKLAKRTESCDDDDDIEPKKPPRFCTLPWLIAIVLTSSLAIGVIVGVILFGGFKDDKSVPETPVDGATDNTTAAVPTGPDLPEDQLKVYDLLCSALDNTDCDLLLDDATPQGQAFQWLVGDQISNPDLNAFGDERIIRRYALVTFYYSTGGPSWANRLAWLSGMHECEWYSSAEVRSGCSNGETFDTLAMNNNNLQGELPRELMLLKDLKTISLVNPVKTAPFLKGSLPTGWMKLSSLTSVTISGNQFSGSILDEFGAMPDLEVLDLSYNGFNGEIPSTFYLLTKMITMNLAGNQLTGNIHESIFRGAKSLVDINLEENRITGIPSTIAMLTELRSLNLATNNLSEFPYDVTALVGLSSLNLRDNTFQNEIPFQIGKMEGLQSLDLSYNSFSSEIPVELGKLVQLEFLDLSNNELTGPIPTTIVSLVNLARLLLNRNKLSGDLPAELASLTKVKEVRFDENNFTGFVPDDVCTLYNAEPSPTSYADCDELLFSSCFTYCCTDSFGCFCRFEKTDPLRCVKGLQ